MSQAITIRELINNKDFSAIEEEPEWLTELRKEAWNKFLLLPWESDPNMLNLLKPKLLQDFQIAFPSIAFVAHAD